MRKVYSNFFILKKKLIFSRSKKWKESAEDKPPMEAKLILFLIPHAGILCEVCESGVFTKRYEKEREWKKRAHRARVDEALFAGEEDAGGKLIPYGICNISPSCAPYENLDWNGKVLKDNAGTSEWMSEQRREREIWAAVCLFPPRRAALCLPKSQTHQSRKYGINFLTNQWRNQRKKNYIHHNKCFSKSHLSEIWPLSLEKFCCFRKINL